MTAAYPHELKLWKDLKSLHATAWPERAGATERERKEVKRARVTAPGRMAEGCNTSLRGSLTVGDKGLFSYECP